MVQPKASSYRDALDYLPDEFKEDVIHVRRYITARDDYNKPIITEYQETVRGRVQIIDAADRIPEEGGIRETTQARIFLKIPTVFFEDQFNYVGAPDPTIWSIAAGSDVSVDGTKCIIGLSTAIATLEDFEKHFTIQTRVTNGATASPGLTLELFSLSPNQWASIILHSPSVGDITIHTRGPVSNKLTQIIGVNPTDNIWRIVWTSGFILFFKDDELLFAETDPDYIPDADDVKIRLWGNSQLPNNLEDKHHFDYVETVGTISPNDHFIIRGKRYAIMQDILTTHLQQELFVQEVIPT